MLKAVSPLLTTIFNSNIIHWIVWGNGEIFADYQTSLGKPVDWYEEGHRWKVLISLRASRNRGEQESFWIERTIKNGFTKQVNNFSVRIDHPTNHLSLAVIFPNGRLP
jgi:hypothetical protein